MKRNISTITDELFHDQESLSERILENVDVPIHDLDREAHQQLLQDLLTKAKEYLLQNESMTTLDLDFDPSNILAKKGYHSGYILNLLAQFRLQFLQEIETGCENSQASVEECFLLMRSITVVFDRSIQNSTENFNSDHKNKLQEMENEMLEISAPIVPVESGIFVLPLIGSINEERAEHISRNVIPEAVEAKAETLIIDFSGIHIFDTFVAQRLFTITQTLRLLGITPVITGVRPDMAQTTVQLGVKINDIEMYNDVKTALAHQ